MLVEDSPASEVVSPAFTSLDPLPYQREIVAYLKEAEPALWNWGSSAEVRGEFADEMRTELLKANYRLDADGHPELAERCATVAQRLEITVPVTLYQSNGGLGLNAMLCHLPGEAHIVFTGPILATFKGAELDAVLAHELAHYRLWEMEGGGWGVAAGEGGEQGMSDAPFLQLLQRGEAWVSRPTMCWPRSCRSSDSDGAGQTGLNRGFCPKTGLGRSGDGVFVVCDAWMMKIC